MITKARACSLSTPQPPHRINCRALLSRRGRRLACEGARDLAPPGHPQAEIDLRALRRTTAAGPHAVHQPAVPGHSRYRTDRSGHVPPRPAGRGRTWVRPNPLPGEPSRFLPSTLEPVSPESAGQTLSQDSGEPPRIQASGPSPPLTLNDHDGPALIPLKGYQQLEKSQVTGIGVTSVGVRPGPTSGTPPGSADDAYSPFASNWRVGWPWWSAPGWQRSRRPRAWPRRAIVMT
jgi:hypothetical protein